MLRQSYRWHRPEYIHRVYWAKVWKREHWQDRPLYKSTAFWLRSLPGHLQWRQAATTKIQPTRTRSSPARQRRCPAGRKWALRRRAVPAMCVCACACVIIIINVLLPYQMTVDTDCDTLYSQLRVSFRNRFYFLFVIFNATCGKYCGIVGITISLSFYSFSRYCSELVHLGLLINFFSRPNILIFDLNSWLNSLCHRYTFNNEWWILGATMFQFNHTNKVVYRYTMAW